MPTTNLQISPPAWTSTINISLSRPSTSRCLDHQHPAVPAIDDHQLSLLWTITSCLDHQRLFHQVSLLFSSLIRPSNCNVPQRKLLFLVILFSRLYSFHCLPAVNLFTQYENDLRWSTFLSAPQHTNDYSVIFPVPSVYTLININKHCIYYKFNGIYYHYYFLLLESFSHQR